MWKHRISSTLASVSLILAAIAFVPSAAAFTPAILLSGLALVLAAVSAALGAWRTAMLTAVMVGATVLVSPVFVPHPLARVEYLLIAGPLTVAILAVMLFIGYRRAARAPSHE